MILHTFGWAIVYNIDDNGNTEVYPARVKFRGFNEHSNTNGYMKENANDLLEEASE